MNLSERLDNITRLRKEAQAEVKNLFTEFNRELFEKNPNLESYSWPQYAPYFNDGDPCYFGVRAYPENIRLNGYYPEELEDEPDLLTNYQELQDVISSTIDALDDADPSFFETFTSDGLVTIHRDGRHTVEDYSHD